MVSEKESKENDELYLKVEKERTYTKTLTAALVGMTIFFTVAMICFTIIWYKMLG